MPKNPEYETSFEQSKAEHDESGYSEKQMDLNMEIQAGEWQSLKKFKTYRDRSRQGKIIASYQAVSNRLNQLVGMYYRLVRDNPQKAVKLYEEIKKLRLIQEILLQCLVWSRGAGSGSAGEKQMKDMVPPDVWEMIE